jgi:signal transduction histidine kinase
MKTQSLFFKLICIYGLTVAFFVVCVIVVLYAGIKNNAYNRFDEALLRDARTFISQVTLEPDGLKVSEEGLNPRVSSILRDLMPYVFVTDDLGRNLKSHFSSRYMQATVQSWRLSRILQQRSGIGEVVTDDGMVFRYVSLGIPSTFDSTKRIIHIGRSTDRLRWVLGTYVWFCVYTVPFMLAISVAAGWLITNRALRPFKDIARTAEQINSENLHTQIITKYREEEVQILVGAFNAMVDRLNRSFQQLRTFNADAAHELRTPLSVLQGDTEFLLRSSNLTNDEIKSALKSNLEELERLTRIINDMLMLSEAEAGEQVLFKESIYLKLFINSLVEQLRTLAAKRNIQIKILDVPDVQLKADRMLFHRAILNILDNAIKYSKDNAEVEVCRWRSRITVLEFHPPICPIYLTGFFELTDHVIGVMVELDWVCRLPNGSWKPTKEVFR